MKKKLLLVFGGGLAIAILIIVAVAIFNFVRLGNSPVISQDNISNLEKDFLMAKEGDEILDSEEVANFQYMVSREGEFVDVDRVHKGAGTAQIVELDGQKFLKFEEDFKVTNGPDLYVYLSPNKFSENPELGEFVSLGRLQSAEGEQLYSLGDEDIDFVSVVIYCRAFSTLFSYAEL